MGIWLRKGPSMLGYEPCASCLHGWRADRKVMQADHTRLGKTFYRSRKRMEVRDRITLLKLQGTMCSNGANISSVPFFKWTSYAGYTQFQTTDTGSSLRLCSILSPNQ